MALPLRRIFLNFVSPNDTRFQYILFPKIPELLQYRPARSKRHEITESIDTGVAVRGGEEPQHGTTRRMIR